MEWTVKLAFLDYTGARSMPTNIQPATGLPPLLVRMLDQQAATGLPPAYLPKDEERRDTVNKKMLALYGLKWNPFAPDVPVEALHVTRRIELFCSRVQQLVGEGGFALVTGAPGTGKSVTLRILAERLGAQRDVWTRHRHAPAGRPRRLLSRDGRSVIRVGSTQPLGRSQGAA